MSKGYVMIAQNSGDIDYHRMAYALALSIKNTQSSVNNVCLITDNRDNVSDSMYSVFDDVVEIPWGDHAVSSEWKIDNKWKYFYATPYDESVILDTDMIFTGDISDWWETMSLRDVWATTSPKTYRGEVIADDFYRKTFTSNNLPNVYTAFMYFKKSKLAGELFKLVEIIFNNWQKFFYEFLDETRPRHLSGDVAYALAMKILGIEHECTISGTDVPSFVHMKSRLQGIPAQYMTEDWTKHIPTIFTDAGILKIGNYRQNIPFHYHVKEWLTDEILKQLEANFNV